MIYGYDGSLAGLLSCVFRAFQFREFGITLQRSQALQQQLFTDSIEVATHTAHAERVWIALQKKLSSGALRRVYYAFLSEQPCAHQHIFNFLVYVFQSKQSVAEDYGHPDVLAVAQWAKQVGREKHRMEAFVRFKKTKQALYLSLIRPDFDVLPIIQAHFQQRYQDQQWLIYDERRRYGIYYDLTEIHQVAMHAEQIDSHLGTGQSQQFSVALDEQERQYDQLWKDYFQSVNISSRQNLKLHIQYLPKRYWRYLNEKDLS
ncbi:TIGR03915 family putative DNA repair protein [Acinetobacter larvae]|uniref:DNA metabolism protein n=1 Tax=Acinetobacter larvae TaxID=1789224 RepID=A0A1B2M0N5_9GAMM|nr:TIGR03915 family putative DNA repair protein [Acinetobacter larvae]AOA58766.1 DNA metabolism protein [Acinetobacter larvae]